MKTVIRFYLAIVFVVAIGHCHAQTPQWNWAKGVDSNEQDNISAFHLDSAGNVYEIINFEGNSMQVGSQTFVNSNPYISGGNNSGHKSMITLSFTDSTAFDKWA